MNQREDITIEGRDIRCATDENLGEFYYSVVDVIDTLGVSKDPRNYWKVLKNRLNKRQNKLVTECNQCKLKSSDGKYYLTDVASSSTLLEIIDIICHPKVEMFEDIFNKIESESLKSKINYFGGEKISTEEVNGIIKTDVYRVNDSLFVKALVVGVESSNIFISLSCDRLMIRFERKKNSVDCEIEELRWGVFSRSISLPLEVDIDRVTTHLERGLLLIELHIEDKERTRIVKVK